MRVIGVYLWLGDETALSSIYYRAPLRNASNKTL